MFLHWAAVQALWSQHQSSLAAHIVQDYYNANLDYTHMEWPAYNPDFNPIEQAWDMLGQALSKVYPAPTTKEDLLLQLQIEWGNIRQMKITWDQWT